MNILESISAALSGITGNKMRALLTMFGIIVGISSVMMITSIGEGYKESINKQFESMGLDVFDINTNYSEDITIYEYDRLNYSDVETIRKYSDVVEAGGLYYIHMGNAVQTLDPNTMRSVLFNGVDTQYLRIHELDMIYGRTLSGPDVDFMNNVVIIDEDFAIEVFGTADCIGETLKIDSTWFPMSLKIIGVYASNSESQMRQMYNMPASTYVPIGITQNVFYAEDSVDYITVKAADTSRLTAIGNNAVRLIELNHGNEGEDKYTFSSIADNLSQANSVISLFTMFLGVVAGISLLVGGIGVMNIMLVSVTERTREIGIRKSLGATDGNIQFQFLVEAVILTGIGGAIGILLGYLGGLGLASIASVFLGSEIIPYISTSTIIMAVVFSAAIGIVFGVYPASRAAKLDPIEALRFE